MVLCCDADAVCDDGRKKTMNRDTRAMTTSARCDVEVCAHRARQARGTRSVRRSWKWEREQCRWRESDVGEGQGEGCGGVGVVEVVLVLLEMLMLGRALW